MCSFIDWNWNVNDQLSCVNWNTNPTSRFNKYLQISAQTVRKALKPEFQTQKVQARGNTDAKVIKFENGVAKDAEPLAKH